MTFLADLDFMRAHVNMGWYGCRRVLITGATGFVGSWLAYALSGACDLTLSNRGNYDEVLEGEYDAIFHCAPVEIDRVLLCAMKNNAKVLYTSSGAVYGGVREKVGEEHIAMPKTAYGLLKLKNELILKSSGLDYVNARMFAFIGRGLTAHLAARVFVENAMAGKPLLVLGGGKAVRTYLYSADLAVWLLRLMEKGRGVYNVGSMRETTIFQLAQLIAEYTHAEVELDPREFYDPAPYYVPDVAKAQGLGLVQWHDIEYGIRSMIA